MRNENRLSKLEQHRPDIVYPEFADMYSTQTKADYMAWMLKHNPTASQEDIEALNIRHLADMY